MKYVRMIGIVILTMVLIVLIISSEWHGGSKIMEKEESYARCDYFNGEVVETSEEYLALKPIAEWQWKEVKRVIIPMTQQRGDLETIKISTPLFEGEVSDLKPGDRVRVAFNAETMECFEDEVSIGVVYMLFRVTEDMLEEWQ